MSASDSFAVDTNLLAFGTGRRLLHCLALENGISLVALPEVCAESHRVIARIQENRWERRLNVDTRYTSQGKSRIVQAVMSGAQQWLDDELKRDDNCLQPVAEVFDVSENL